MKFKTRVRGTSKQVGKTFPVIEKKRLPKIPYPKAGGKVTDVYVSQLYHPRSPPLEMWKEVALDYLGDVRSEIDELADSDEQAQEMEKELEQIIGKVKAATQKGTLITVAAHIMPPLDKSQLEACMERYLRAKKLIPYKPMKSELLMGKLKQRLSGEFDIKKGDDYR